jgi:hypothetical protein
LQLLIFRQDAPLISPHPAHLAVEPYRASGLVRWRKAAGHWHVRSWRRNGHATTAIKCRRLTHNRSARSDRPRAGMDDRSDVLATERGGEPAR